MRQRLDIFLVSLLILFLELAFIRWLPAHVLFLTYFTNTVLLASFLGMSAGCLAARRPGNALRFTPAVIAALMLAAHAVEYRLTMVRDVQVSVGGQVPEVVFFGAEPGRQDLTRFVIPIEWVAGFFFLTLALAFLGLGQRLGRALAAGLPPIQGYAVNLAGSLVGILAFTALSWAQLPPFWWFLPVVIGIGYLSRGRSGGARRDRGAALATGASLLAILVLADPDPLLRMLRATPEAVERYWSPYYRIDYRPAPLRRIEVNLIFHQLMQSRQAPAPGYALPYLLNRDTAGAPFHDVLVIGAGSGNDVSRALDWGAARVDAVEIDPVILRLGRRDHPDRPYQDLRVDAHVDDGRSFLRSRDHRYDLVVYALVDSLVLHSGLGSIRLESYLFTKEALIDVRRRLKPGGLFVIYNYFRQGWIVTRLHDALTEAFGEEPLVLTLPVRETIRPDESFWAFTVLMAGDTGRVRRAFAERGPYGLPAGEIHGPRSLARFGAGGGESLEAVRPARMVPPDLPLRTATDDWPFLYLRRATIPELTRRGVAVMAVCAALLLVLVSRDPAGKSGSGLHPRMFFLGAGFMLVETRAVVHMALLFGSTWIVNSVVLAAVLLTILLATLFVLLVRPARPWPWLLGLAVSLGANALVPLGIFLGAPAGLRTIGACVFLFTPLLFAGVVFGREFALASSPDRALGANVAGAMLGGFLENTSMLVGFQGLAVLALALYALAALPWEAFKPGSRRRDAEGTGEA